MKKRILSLLVIMCMLLPCIPVVVSAESGDVTKGITWSVENNVLTISGTGTMPDYADSNDKPWESYRTSITSAVVGDGITYIGARAFQECTALTTVTMADSVTSMGTYVFNACSALTSVKLSENLATLPNGTFNNAKKIMALEIPYKTTITNGNDNNSALRGVSTDLVLTVYEGSAAHTWAKSSGTDGKTPTIYKLNAALSYETKTLGGNVTSNGSIKWAIQDGVLTISGTGAMSTNYDDTTYVTRPWQNYVDLITKVVVGEGITSIGNKTFQLMSKMTEFDMADTVTSMGTYMFNGCGALASVKLSENLAQIPNGTFNGASALTTLEIPFNTAVINDSDSKSSFRGVNSALVLTVYEGSSAHTWAASGTDGVTPTIKKLNKTLAYVVKTVEKPSGSGNVTDDGSIKWALEDGVLTISGTGAMPNYSATSDQPWNALRDNITKVVIGDGITYIGNRAFQEDTNLITVIMANSVTSMGTWVFNACSNLTSVTLSKNLATVPRATFAATALMEVTVPSKTAITDESFLRAKENIVINVYAGSVAHTAFGADLTITDENSVARVCTLINTESGTDGTTTWSWDYNTKTVTIGGTGAMTSWQTTDAAATDYFNRRGWDGYKASVNNVVIGNGITAVGEYAFFQCSNVSDIELPASLKRLYRYSFADMILDEVSIPAGVETIDANAFRGLSSNPTITKLVVNGNDTILRVLISNGVEQTALNRQTNAVVYCNYASTVAATAKAQGIPYRYMDVDYVIESYDSETMTANIINSTTAAKNATVIFVAYKDKAISDVSTVSSELEVGATPVVAGSDFDQTDADKVSVFVWDGLNTMEPVGRTFAKAKVWMLGDSIMAYWGDGRYPQTGWGESFKKVVTSDLVVENRAVSGATAQRYYNYGWKGNDYFTEKNPVYNEVKEGDFVILSFLHNDYSQTVNTTSDNYKSTEYINTYKRYIEMFAEDCAAKGAKLILVVPPNAGGTATNYHAQPVDGVNVGDFSAVIPAVAKELGIPCVNIHKWTLDNLAADASFADRIYLNRNYLNGLVASGAMTKTEQEEHTNSRVAAGNDTTHPSIIGCKSIAEFVAAQLKTMNTGLEKFLK